MKGRGGEEERIRQLAAGRYTDSQLVLTYRSSEHVVHECAQTPPVHGLAMPYSLQDLRRPAHTHTHTHTHAHTHQVNSQLHQQQAKGWHQQGGGTSGLEENKLLQDGKGK